MKILTALCLLFLSTAAWAQEAPSTCPTLPATADLQWEQRVDASFITCKAVTTDGRQVLNMMLTARNPKIRMDRSLRAEESTFSGEKVYWYKLDLGGRNVPGAESRRITVVDLDDDRYAQVWINADSTEELDAMISLAQQLDVSATSARLSVGN